MLGEAYLVNTGAQNWLDFTEGPAVSLRFGWHQMHLKISFRSDAEVLVLFAAPCSDCQEVSHWSPNSPELVMALGYSDVL